MRKPFVTEAGGSSVACSREAVWVADGGSSIDTGLPQDVLVSTKLGTIL